MQSRRASSYSRAVRCHASHLICLLTQLLLFVKGGSIGADERLGQNPFRAVMVDLRRIEIVVSKRSVFTKPDILTDNYMQNWSRLHRSTSFWQRWDPTEAKCLSWLVSSKLHSMFCLLIWTRSIAKAQNRAFSLLSSRNRKTIALYKPPQEDLCLLLRPVTFHTLPKSILWIIEAVIFITVIIKAVKQHNAFTEL